MITIKNRIKDFLKQIGLFSRIKVWRDNFKNYLPTQRAHRKKMVSFYGQFISPGDMVFDVGANIGNRTDIFLKLGATVVVIEPQPICLEQLHIKYKNNPDVHIVPKGLGSETGEHHLHLSNADTISTMSDEWLADVKETGRFKDANWDQTINVPITTLDELIKEYGTPAFCKIDVEGFELEVINGLSSPLQSFSFEYAHESHLNATVIIEKMCSLSMYLFNFSKDESMSLEHDNWLDEEEFISYLEQQKSSRGFGDVYCKQV